jgi:hypothetical protein
MADDKPEEGAERIVGGHLFRAVRQPNTFHLTVVGASGLSRVGLMKNKPSAYAIVKIDGFEVGRGEVMVKECDPTWEETFDVALPDGKSLVDCKVEVRVYDLEARRDPSKNKHRFLGRALLSGQELFYMSELKSQQRERRRKRGLVRTQSTLVRQQSIGHLLKQREEEQFKYRDSDSDDGDSDPDAQKTLPCPLIFTDDMDMDLQTLVGGRLEVAGWFEATTVKWIQDDEDPDLDVFANDTNLDGGGRADLLEVVVYAARGLARVDLFRAANPYVTVTLNGKLVGRTELMLQTTNPRWDHERVFVPVMAGLRSRSAELRIEVCSESLRTEVVTFLGEAVFKGRTLNALLGSKCDPHEKLGNNAADGQGAVSARGQWVELHTNMYKTLKQNAQVQGQVMVGGSYHPSSYDWRSVNGGACSGGVSVASDQTEGSKSLPNMPALSVSETYAIDPDGVLQVGYIAP